MRVIERIKKKFEYPKNMKEQIIQYEEKMLRTYSEIISHKYNEFFEKKGCTVELNLAWGNDALKPTWSKKRTKFKYGYWGAVSCEIKKNGKTVEILCNEEDVGWILLDSSWRITRINFPFQKVPYYLIEDFEELYEDMEEFQELLEEYSVD